MELHLDLQVASRLHSSDQQLGTFPDHRPAKKVDNIIIMNANIKKKKIHNKMNIMLHVIHVYNFKVFKM